MGSSTSKPPPAPDPQQIIALENQYNRYNTSNPFGTSSWTSGGPGGHETQTQTLSPQMQQALDGAFNASQTPLTKAYVPQGMDQIASAIMGKVGSHYGVDNVNTNLKSQGQSPPSANMPGQISGGQMGNPQQMQAAMGGFHGGRMGMPQQMGQSPPQMGSPQVGQMGSPTPYGQNPQLAQLMQSMGGGNFANTGGVSAMPNRFNQNNFDPSQLLQMFGGPGVGQIGPRTMPVGNQGS